MPYRPLVHICSFKAIGSFKELAVNQSDFAFFLIATVWTWTSQLNSPLVSIKQATQSEQKQYSEPKFPGMKYRGKTNVKALKWTPQPRHWTVLSTGGRMKESCAV